ncbi:hypothetical protein RB536_14415 [Escherichia coli]|nr:hypothetical protein RB536_14415 [Escherichia coli]
MERNAALLSSFTYALAAVEWRDERYRRRRAVKPATGDLIATRTRAEGKWLTRQQVADVQDNIRHALTGLPMPANRLDAFDNCRELWRKCQRWLGILKAIASGA